MKHTTLSAIYLALLCGCGGVGPVETTSMKRNDDAIPFRPVLTGSVKAGLVPDSSVTEEAVAQYASMPFPLNGGFENFSQGMQVPPDHWWVDNEFQPGVWGTHVNGYQTAVHTGSNALRFTPVGSSVQLDTDNFEVFAGQKPIVNFWYKVNGTSSATTEDMELYVDYLDASGNRISKVAIFRQKLNAYNGITPTGWLQAASYNVTGATMIAPAGAKLARFELYVNGSSSVDVLVDDFTAVWVQPQESWNPADLNSPWANFGGGTYGASYMMDSMGFVNVRGGVKSGTIGTAVLNLPTGYRPVGIARFITSASGGAFAETQVDSNGDIKFNTVSSGSNALIFLDGIRFKAEQ